MVLIIDVLDYLRDANDFALAGSPGLIAGILHHFLIQYPHQAEIFTPIYAFAAVSMGFALLLWHISNNACVETILAAISFFDLIYVSFLYSGVLIDKLSTAMVLKVVYNVLFRHRGIPTRFTWAATDLRWWFAYRTGYSFIYLQNLHKELGILMLLSPLTIEGDVVRIQPNHISFNSVAAYEAIHGVKTTARKAQHYTHVMRTTPTSPLTMFAEPSFFILGRH
jgi:hypothetical protein